MRDGSRIEAWWRPAATSSATSPAPAVLVFHGNGELIDDGLEFSDAWHALGVSVLLVEYRGYGRSEGVPGLTACQSDAVEWYDRLAAEPGVRTDFIVSYGYSLGGIFAAEVAAQRPVAAIALESTVSSLRQAARDRGVWLLFTHERFDLEAILHALPPAKPVLITHGSADEVVPFHHFNKLVAARPTALAIAGTHAHLPLAIQSQTKLLRTLLDAVPSHPQLPSAK